MRTLALAALTMVTALGATQADAQRLGGGQTAPGASYPMPGAGQAVQQRLPMAPHVPMAQPGRPNPGMHPVSQPNRQRWGGMVGGRWQGGANAPGGWNAYHRPSRGFRLSHYWFSPSFFLNDYAGYGLSDPPLGYGWYRYYDDAVLLDSRGRVYDSVDGLDWNGGYGEGGYNQGGYNQGGYDQGGYGYQQDTRSGYGQPYPPQHGGMPPVVQNGNVTTYTTSSGYASGGYVAGGYAYPGATTTVVTIQGAPSVTTTTTEYVEETRTRYIAPRRVYRAPVKHYYRPVRRTCGCKKVEQPILGS
jgi:Ni/Co efflux regulator RcnB